ncbi:MAG TPA: flagellar basal-body MS-ring/collar protein FliF [Sedimentisphaerales bacterium]|nr:flagellar basal-body MS-ring/collar protein FliF [Sedimentisphaerales bacterium]
MNFLQQIRAIWQKVSLVQRALLIAVVLTFIIVSALLVHWARRPDMQMLYRDLSAEEASKITEKISEKGIGYELRNGGTSIYVPKEKVYQLRLDMAREGLPAGEDGGYRIFDNEKIGISPFVQNVNLKRALQEELAKSIQMIEGVVHARVHIVNSEQTLFTSEAGKTTASVILRLKPGYRASALNIAAITHLVAGSVEGLTAENVTVIDSDGHLLSGKSDDTMANGAGTVQDYRERVEQNLADKVEDMLTTVLGPGRATVKVSAIIDMTSTNIVTEKYEPKGVAVKEEIKEKTRTEGGNIPAEGEPAVAGGTEKDNTTVSEFAFGKTVETKVDLPGEIQGLSVAAFVDLSPADVNESQAGAQTAMIMELSAVEEIIKKALGLKDTDSLKVVNVKFPRPAALLTEEEPSNWPRYIAIARQASLGIMAICALLVLRVFSGAKRKATTKGAAEQLPATEGAAGLLPGAEAPEPLMLRRQITDALQSNPEQVKQLFSNWLEEKEE